MRRRRVLERYDDARFAFLREAHDVVRGCACQILRMDPNNRDARELLGLSLNAARLHGDADERERRHVDETWKAALQVLQRVPLPPVGTVEFPEDWLREISSGRRLEGAAAIRRVLTSKRARWIDWDGEGLEHVLQYLGILTHVDFRISASVSAKDLEEVEIELTLDDVTLCTVLDLCTEPYDLVYMVREDHVLVGTVADRDGEPMTIRYFDVKDIVDPPPFADAKAAEPIMAPADVIPWIRGRLTEGTFEEDRAVLEMRNRILIVRHRRHVLDAVAELVEEQSCFVRHPTVSGAPPRWEESWK